MFKREYLGSYIKWGVIAAIAFCIPMLIFLYSGRYSETWWLFVGNGLFLAAIIIYMLQFNKARNENASTQTMVAAGHIATVIGVVVSCIVAAIGLAIFVHNGGSGQSDVAFADAPSQTGTGPTNGMIFILYMCATIGNICGGSFSSIMIPYAARKNQTKDRRSQVLNN